MKIAVTWEMCGYVDIEADTMEKAMEKFNRDYDHIELPSNGEYIDGSFRLNSTDVEIMKILSGIEI